jgi:hypothetical protein
MRCGKPTPRASYTNEAGVACAPCAKFFKPATPCSVCGNLSRYNARDFKAGFSEPACQSCRSRSFITCAHCQKYRPAAGEIGGCSVCARCLERKGHAFVCPECGMPGARHSASRCQECYWRARARQAISAGISDLREPWARDAYAALGQRLITGLTPQRAALRLPRYIEFFARIETLSANPKWITAAAIAEHFGGMGMRKSLLPLGFLIGERIIAATAADLAEAAEVNRQRLKLNAARELWYGPILERFYGNMLRVRARYERRGWTGRHSRFALTTITRALAAASLFLSDCFSAGITSAQVLTTSEVDRFCLAHPGYRPTLARFIRYLNRSERLFSAVDIKLIPVGLTDGLLLPTQRYQDLLATWTRASEKQRKPALIALLLLLYAQPITDTVRLKLSDLKIDQQGIYTIAFKRASIALHEAINALFMAYLEARRSLSPIEDVADNDYLFPGRLATGHLSEQAVFHFLKQYDVDARQVFATAVHQFCLNGIQHPKVLVKALGISMPTAMKYMELVTPRQIAEIERPMRPARR